MATYATDEDRQAFLTAMGDTSEAEPETPEAPADEQGTPDEGDEGIDGPVESDEQAPEEHTEAPPEDEATHVVVVNGQTIEVPTSELIRGYSRQADYTQKMQMLAVQRRQLTDANELLLAMDRNPQETLRVLAHHYNVNLGEQPERDTYESNGTQQPPGPTPEQRQLQELVAWQQAELNRQREAAVDNELARLHHTYGEFSDDDLFGYAVQHNVQDLETALRAMTFQKPLTSRTDKRKVAGMNGGSARSAVAQPKSDSGTIESFQDAYEAAKRELAR